MKYTDIRPYLLRIIQIARARLNLSSDGIHVLCWIIADALDVDNWHKFRIVRDLYTEVESNG